MARLKWLDDGIARGEAAIAAFVLLLMIFLAALQALLHNLASGLEMTWANDALTQFDWIDQFLQKGTLWLAFLGASLATHADRHIAIDALPRVLPGRLRLLTKAIVSLAAAATSYFLARVFFSAVRITALERPLEYEVLSTDGPVHLCDAAIADVASAELSRPELFCAIRRGLTALGVQTETPVAALQLIVPAMFLVIAVRLTARSIGAFAATARDDGAGERPLAAKPGRGGKG